MKRKRWFSWGLLDHFALGAMIGADKTDGPCLIVWLAVLTIAIGPHWRKEEARR